MVDLSKAISIEDLRRIAKRRVPRAIFDFFDGGAEDEVTLRANRAAFERVRLLPRVLVDVSAVDLKAELFGQTANMPLAIAPTGGISAGRVGAELALARAAKEQLSPKDIKKAIVTLLAGYSIDVTTGL
jgi:(S)-mandelate dehydrogenase